MDNTDIKNISKKNFKHKDLITFLSRGEDGFGSDHDYLSLFLSCVKLFDTLQSGDVRHSPRSGDQLTVVKRIAELNRRWATVYSRSEECSND